MLNEQQRHFVQQRHFGINTVKTHLRSIYQKLGGASRSEAIERAVKLRLL